MTRSRDVADIDGILTAKGDIYAATAAATPARLGVGANGDTIVADSSTATGLRWQGSTEAGKNFIINGGMDIWQRGTSFTNPGSTYTVDRWTGYWSANGTVTQETTTVPSGCRYALRMTATANGGGNNFYQMIETDNTIPLAGKTVTFSAYVAGTAGKTPTIGIDSSTVVNDGLFGSYTNIATSSSVTTTGSYQLITVTGTVPSTAKTIRVQLNSGPINNTEFMLWGKVQLEIGSVPTTFSRAGGTIQGELAACQRYFANVVPSTADYGTVISMFQAASSTTAKGGIRFPVPMRTSASITLAAATNFTLANATYTPIGGSSFTYALGNTVDCRIDMSVASGLVAGNATALSGNTANLLIQASAEL